MTSALLLWHFNIIISTHTLTWSVTIGVNANYNMKRISTHTLTWSVTLGYYFGTEYRLNFNSHAHVERDTLELFQKRWLIISTHTLTWSVTPEISFKCTETENFNSHAHVERDDWEYGSVLEKINFNSHAHVERDITW